MKRFLRDNTNETCMKASLAQKSLLQINYYDFLTVIRNGLSAFGEQKKFDYSSSFVIFCAGRCLFRVGLL